MGNFTWRRALVALGLLAAHKPIIATGHRAMQYGTAYTVRGLLLLLAVVFTTLAFALGFSWMEMHAAVFVTAVVFTVLYLFTAVLPVCSVPGSILAGSAKKYFARVCIGLVFILCFFLFCYLVPIGKSPAITFGLLILLMIALAALASGHVDSDLDNLIGKKIWGLVWISIALGVAGLFYLTIPVTKTDTARNKSAEVSKGIVDARGVNQEQYILAIMQCRVGVKNFTQLQMGVYGKGCGADVPVKGLTRDEVRTYWPDFFKAPTLIEGGNTGATTTAGNARPTEGSGLKPFDAKTWQAWFEKNVPYGEAIWNFIIVWHVYLIIALTILSILGLRKKKSDVAETKSDAKKAVTTKSGGIGMLAIALAIVAGWAGYTFLEVKPRVVAETRAVAPVAARAILPVEEAGNWMANYRDVNNHEEYRLPQDAWHGKAVSLLPGSYVANVASITLVFDSKDPGTNLHLRGGECGVGRTGILWQCVGYWKTGTEAGHYRLEQELDPRTFRVSLYSRNTSLRAGAQPIKEIRFVRNH